VLLLNELFQLYHSAALLLVLGGLWLSKDRQVVGRNRLPIRE